MCNDAGLIRSRVTDGNISAVAPSSRSVSRSRLPHVLSVSDFSHGSRRSSTYPNAREPNTSFDGLHASVAGLETVDLNCGHVNEEQKAAALADADTMMDVACVEVVVDTDLNDVMSYSTASSASEDAGAMMGVVHVEVVVDTDLNDVMSYSTASSDAEYEYVGAPNDTSLPRAAYPPELGHGANIVVNAGVNTWLKVASGVVHATGAAKQRASSLAEACARGDTQNADFKEFNAALTYVGNGAQAVVGNLGQDMLSGSSALARKTAGVVLKGSKQTAGFVQGIGSAENKKKGFETVNNFLTTAGQTIRGVAVAHQAVSAVIESVSQAINSPDGDIAVEMLDLSQK